MHTFCHIVIAETRDVAVAHLREGGGLVRSHCRFYFLTICFISVRAQASIVRLLFAPSHTKFG
jgi:hypothetical protein